MAVPVPPGDRAGSRTGSRAGSRAAARRRALAVLPVAAYPLLLAAGTLVLRSRPAARRAAWIAAASTDLHNLAGHPVRSLLASGLICERQLAVWLLLALAGLVPLAARTGAGRALALAVAVHVLATLASQALVAYRIGTGSLPGSARVMTDVGPSYVVVAALAAAVAYGTPLAGRVVAALGLGLLAPSLFGGLAGGDVAAVGHLASILLALLLGWLPARRAGTAERRAHRARPPRRPSADSNRGP